MTLTEPARSVLAIVIGVTAVIGLNLVLYLLDYLQ